MAKLIAGTYGEALFELAIERQAMDSFAEEIKLVQSVLSENEELIKLLNHPKIAQEEKISVIENIFKGRICDDICGFLVIIVEKGRYNEFNRIFSYFLSKYKKYKNIGVANITSAVELNREQKAAIEKKLLATTNYVEFELNYSVDTSLIGGIILRIGDRVVDGSIRTKLNNLAKELGNVKLS